MRFDSGTTDIPTAGTRVRVNNIPDRVKAIQFYNPNAGNIYYGRSDVASTNGITLATLSWSPPISFGNGSVAFSVFWADAAVNGYDIQWQVILETGEDS